MLPTTDAEFQQFIDSQIDVVAFTATMEQARTLYEQTKARRHDCKQQLDKHDANKPDRYSSEWTVQRYEIVNTIVNTIEQVDQCRGDFHKAQAALLNARRRIIAKFFPGVTRLSAADGTDA